MHGMANLGEPLVNVVIDNKPKMLIGLPKKKGTWWVQGLEILLTQITHTIGEEAGPNPCLVHTRNVVNRSGS